MNPDDPYVQPEVGYVRSARPEVRWINREGKHVLQQLYEDGWGHLHWVDVPLWTLAQLVGETDQ